MSSFHIKGCFCRVTKKPWIRGKSAFTPACSSLHVWTVQRYDPGDLWGAADGWWISSRLDICTGTPYSLSTCHHAVFAEPQHKQAVICFPCPHIHIQSVTRTLFLFFLVILCKPTQKQLGLFEPRRSCVMPCQCDLVMCELVSSCKAQVQALQWQDRVVWCEQKCDLRTLKVMYFDRDICHHRVVNYYSVHHRACNQENHRLMINQHWKQL